MKLNTIKKCELSIGQFCYSKQGRDKGKVFIVYENVDEDYVLLVNGEEKKISNPKKKNKRHLQKINDIINNFEKMKSDNKIDDLIIKRYIKMKLQEEA